MVLGKFCAVLRLGLCDVLAERGCRVVGDGLDAAFGADEVDAVLLDLDAPACASQAARLLSHRPGLRVIGCSAERPAMRVFAADGSGRERALDAAGLAAAIAGS